MKRSIWLFLSITLVGTGTARADSDGYFCVGTGYLAYQFGMAAPSAALHRLYVVRYGEGRISEPAVFQLPQFQVHGMRCGTGAVDVAAFDAIHTVQLNTLGLPVRSSSVPLSPAGRLPPWTTGARNIGAHSRAAATLNPERHSLHVDLDGSEYILEITAAPDSVRECPSIITARVVQLGRDRREVREQILFRGTGLPACTRRDLEPLVGDSRQTRNERDALLDALVFGVREPVSLTPYSGELRRQFEVYLRRFAAYRTPRRPVGGSEMRMVDAAQVDYERKLVAAARDTGVTALAVAYVQDLKPCYEWEGFADCPERDARFADRYRSDHPGSPFDDYLMLLAAHRWLCAAEGYDYEKKPAEAARTRRAHASRLATARASQVLLIRTAADYLSQRGRCLPSSN